jgi:hypothetical protein
LEFDYENEITVKMFSSLRVASKKMLQYKVDESSDELVKPISLLILKCNRENALSNSFDNINKFKTKVEQEQINSLSDLISLYGSGSSFLVDLKTHEQNNVQTQNAEIKLPTNTYLENDNVLKESTKSPLYIKFPLAPAKTIPYTLSNTKPFTVNSNRYRPILPANSPAKYLPRLLCRNRSFNDANSTSSNNGSTAGGNGNSESGQNLNQTGIMFKRVEKLFEKIKSSPSLDQTTANLLSKMGSFSYPKHTKISPKLLEFRPKENLDLASLYNDEQAYFKAAKKTSYDCYNPFSDKNLILDLYNKPNYTRDFVDTICTVVNNMVNVISIANNQKVASNINNSGNNNNKLILNESFPSKPNKTVTILPKPSNMPTSNTQMLNNILSKPSVIIINNNGNNNNHNFNSTISPGSIPATSSNATITTGNDFNKKIQNPFITAIKSNLNYNQNQQPQNELQSKTIVKCNKNILLFLNYLYFIDHEKLHIKTLKMKKKIFLTPTQKYPCLYFYVYV